MQRGGRQFLLPFRRGLDQAVRTAVRAKELYSFLADGVVYLLSGGFASQQSLELGHDHFVTQLTGVGALLGGNAGGRRNDQADFTGGAGSVAFVQTGDGILGINFAAALAHGIQQQGGVYHRRSTGNPGTGKRS